MYHNMTKKNIIDVVFKVFTIAGLVTLLVLHLDKQNAIVYVDVMKLVSGYNEVKIARSELELQTKEFQAKLDTLKIELESEIKRYELDNKSLTTKERVLTQNLITTKQEQLANYQTIVTEKLQQQDKILTERVLGKVDDYVKKYGKEKGYDIIMASTQYGNILFGKEGKDITENVLKGLNDGL